MSAKHILLVDDNKGQRVTLESILRRSGYEVVTAHCGEAAIKTIDDHKFAAALLDIKMPDITGIDVLKVIKARTPETIVIMMTGYAETDYAIRALNEGASAYLLKPANIDQIKILLNQAIEQQRLVEENKAMSAALLEWKDQLEEKVRQRTSQLMEAHKMALKFYEELKKNFESTVDVLSIAIDQRDALTASHSFRVTEYAVEIARIMELPEIQLEKLRYAGLMHDLGKIEIDKKVLCKDGSLTADEYKTIQSHAHGTFQLLSQFKFKRELADVPEIASSHHERFDGGGYPRNLHGEQIPLLARILAVADVFDAITSRRHYRNAMSIENALSIMRREAGGHFDPVCVEAFFRLSTATFIKIHSIENLNQLDGEDLLELSPLSLDELHHMCETGAASDDVIDKVRRFQKYYQGPVPTSLAHAFPASDSGDEPKIANC